MNNHRITIDDALALKEEHYDGTNPAEGDWLDTFGIPQRNSKDDECEEY